MIPANKDVVERIIEAVYKKYGVQLNKVEVVISNYSVTQDSKIKPIEFDATHNVEIMVNGTECRVSLHKNDDIDTEVDKQVKNQIP